MVILTAGIFGCSDERLNRRSPLAPDVTTTRAAVQDTSAIQHLARGIALAFADRDLRHLLLVDMRDSPFPEFTIHLASYLNSDRGRVISEAAASALGMPRERFLLLLESLPTLEILVPLPFDRVTWTGAANIVVVGFAGTLREAAPQGFLTGYDANGDAVAVPIAQQVDYPFMFIRPSMINFGAHPEEVRKQAPSQSRNTISTRQIERRIRFREDEQEQVSSFNIQPSCDPDQEEQCSGSGSGGGSTGGYELTYDWQECTATFEGDLSPDTPGGWYDNDLDDDGLVDDCEYAVAHAFRPEMVVWSDPLEDITREEYWTVAPGYDPEHLRIFYLFGYHQDVGDELGTDHYGDSEFIIVAAESLSGTDHWRLSTAYYSAHWDTATNSGETHYADELQYADVVYGRPVTWVAEKKHANYRNRDDCGAGANWTDECNANDTRVDFHVYQNANIGHSGETRWYDEPAGTTLIDRAESRDGYPGVEYFWTGAEFCGWYSGVEDCAGGYQNSLWHFDFN